MAEKHEGSKYAAKVRKRKAYARKNGHSGDVPWPVMGIGNSNVIKMTNEKEK